MKKILVLILLTLTLVGCGKDKILTFDKYMLNEDKEIKDKKFEKKEDNGFVLYTANGEYLDLEGTILLYRVKGDNKEEDKNSFRYEIKDVTDYKDLEAKSLDIVNKIVEKTGSEINITTVDSVNKQETYEHMDLLYKNVTNNKGTVRYVLSSGDNMYTITISNEATKYIFTFAYTGKKEQDTVKEEVFEIEGNNGSFGA